MRTDRFESEDPYPPQPARRDRNEVIWGSRSDVVKLGSESYQLHWDAVHVLDGHGKVKVSVPIWGIRSIEVRTSAAQHARGIGDVVLNVAYSGYYGPSTFVLRGVADPYAAKATIRRQIGIWCAFR